MEFLLGRNRLFYSGILGAREQVKSQCNILPNPVGHVESMQRKATGLSVAVETAQGALRECCFERFSTFFFLVGASGLFASGVNHLKSRQEAAITPFINDLCWRPSETVTQLFKILAARRVIVILQSVRFYESQNRLVLYIQPRSCQQL